MNQSKSIYTSIVILGLMLICSASLIGQTQNQPQFDPSYSIALQLVIGSDEAGSKGEIPSELSTVTKQIRTQFGFANYRLASTFLGRLTNNGSFSYKSASNIFGKEKENTTTPVFLEWNIAEFRTMTNSKGGQSFLSQGFNFGARVPVITSMGGGESKMPSVVNYESIGLNLRRIGLGENAPTMVGTLNLPGTSGTIFLIMTIRSVD